MISEELKVATNWLCQAMFEYDDELCPCDWAVVTDEPNQSVSIEWTVKLEVIENAEKCIRVFTFSEVLQGVAAAEPVHKRHKEELAMLMAFEIAVEILRSSKSN